MSHYIQRPVMTEDQKFNLDLKKLCPRTFYDNFGNQTIAINECILIRMHVFTHFISQLF